MATFGEAAAKWLDGESAHFAAPPSGCSIVGDLTQQAAKFRWIAYVAGVRQAGKTSFMMTMARLAAMHWSLPVTYLSAETPTADLRTAMLAGTAGVSMQKVNRFDLGNVERGRVREATEKLDAARVHLCGRPDFTMNLLREEVERHHPLDEPGFIFVDGLRGVLFAELAKDPDFSVERLMQEVRIQSESAFIASGWLDTHWSEMANRSNPLPRWTDVPEPMEWTFPHLIALGKPKNGNVISMLAQPNGGGGDLHGSLAVHGFYARVVDAE